MSLSSTFVGAVAQIGFEVLAIESLADQTARLVFLLCLRDCMKFLGLFLSLGILGSLYSRLDLNDTLLQSSLLLTLLTGVAYAVSLGLVYRLTKTPHERAT